MRSQAEDFLAGQDGPGYRLPMSDIPFATIPAAGRDYVRLLTAMCRLVDALAVEAAAKDALRETFDDVVAGFEAEKAVVLIPQFASEQPRFDVLASSARLKPEQLAGIRSGKSAPGVSSRMILKVLESRQPAILEHPMFLQGTARTAAFTEGINYSAMCAPVLDPTRLDVRALYYLQNTGPDLTRAYRHIDLQFLAAFTELAGRIFAHHDELTTAGAYPGLTLQEIRARLTERVIRRRIEDCGGKYKAAAASLGLSRASFYRLLDHYKIPTRTEQRELDRETEDLSEEQRAPEAVKDEP